MHSIKRGSRSFARSIVSEKLLCRWVAPPAGRVAQIFIGTGARLGIREPSAKTPADMGYFAVQMWLTVRYLQKLEELTREVREHNNFARRMPVVEEQIKVINHRISDLEEAQKIP